MKLNKIRSIRELPVYYLTKRDETEFLFSYLMDNNTRVVAIDQERAPYDKYYYQNPCLVQLATEEEIFLIDLLTENDILLPLKEMFTSVKITKVFFDAPWDIFYFKDYYKIEINNVFDIQIATALIYPNKGTIGLEELANLYLGKINNFKSKKVQKSDWSRRPLTKKQIEYASSEISLFLSIHKNLNKQLINLDLLPFAIYGNEQLKEKLPTNRYNPFSITRIKGFDELSDDKKHLVYHLGIARDTIAKNRNRPPFYVLTNKQLIELTLRPLSKVITKRQKFSKTEKETISKALNEKLPNEQFSRPTNKKFSELSIIQQKLLIWRNITSKEFHIPKRFILSKEDIKSLGNLTKESVVNRIWFSKCNHRALEKILQSLKDSL